MQGQERRFDAYRLAVSQHELRGTLDPALLPRLEDRVAGRGGEVRWTISGTRDPEGRAALVVAIDGSVPLVCQRCLGTMREGVKQSTLVLLAKNDAELVALDHASEQEVVLAREPLDAVTLVEDELLLTLPFAPRHASECGIGARIAPNDRS